MTKFAIAILLFCAGAAGSTANAAYESHFCQTCARLSALAAAPGDSDFRKYAPDRKIDIERVTIEVTPYFDERRIEGVTTLRFSPIAYPLTTLQLDGRDLIIHGTESDHPIADFENTDEDLIFTFDPPIEPDHDAFVTIHYEATPKSGLYFRTPEMGYPANETHLFTQGEAEDHQHWFPSHDYPNEKFSTEVICHVPEGMIALSNGRLIDESPGENGRVRFHWLQEQPHVNYLVSLIVGYFAKEEDQYEDIPLAFFVPTSEAPQIANSFQDTRSIMSFFEEEIGVPYPWDKYYNVCVYDYMFGGMENTSLTTLTSGTLFPDSYENLKSSRGLDAHELAHQWFGDLVTCKDWSHIWLNEGFATYYSLLYDRHSQGEAQFRYGLYRNAQRVLSNREDTTPIVYNAYNVPMDQFSFRAYPKGGWVLHMLRSELGEPVFREAVTTYLERHRYQSVASDALINVFEEVSGRSLGRFFDQWVFLSGAPELNVRYRWDAAAQRARIQVTQTQTINEKRPLFHFPLRLRFWIDGEPVDHVVRIEEKDEDFSFRLPAQPTVVRIDPDVELLARIQFTPARQALTAQLQLEDDVIGRLLAAKELGQKKDADAVASLKDALWDDPFYAVSMEAVQSLAAMDRDDAWDVLRHAGRHPDARVRREVARALNRDYSRETLALLKNLAEQENNPGVRSVLIRALGKYPSESIAEDLLRWMRVDSYHNEVTAAAIAAMETTADAQFVEPLRQFLKHHAERFQSNQLGAALVTLATLNRGVEDRAATLELALAYVEDPRSRVRNGAIRALGALGDPRARGPLSAIAQAEGDAGAQAARSALDALEKTAPVATPSALRQETMALRDQMRALNTQIAELEKQMREAAEDQEALSTHDQ